MKRFRLLFAFFVIILLLLLVPRRTPVVASSSASASLHPNSAISGLPRALGKPASPERDRAALLPEKSPADLLLATAKVLDRRESPLPGTGSKRRISQLVEASFKYPLLQVEETWQRLPDGRDKRLSRTIQVADHAMMRFPAGLDRAAVHAWCARQGLSLRHKLATDDIYLVQAPRAVLDAVDGLIARFKADFGNDQLALAEPDYLQFADVTPSDASFSSLWGLHNSGQSSGVADADIDAPEAWSISTGSRDVIVGIIDTGIDGNHPDLAANMWTNPREIPANGIDDDANGFIDDVRGWDFYSEDADPTDTNSHGTHCAGTIGGVGDNLIGVAGVNWEVSLVALQFLSPSGSGSTSDAVDAVNYSRKLGITLTSNSWGGGGYSATLEQAIRDAGAAGHLFIAAAGNDASDNDSIPHYPSSYNLDNVIAVASTTRTDTLSSFSCFGKTSVDLGAPGSDIFSTIPGNTYGTKSGTSMATPHVSGAAALLYAISPDRSHIDIKDVLLQTSDALPALSGICVSGGRLNLHRAAEHVAGPRVLPATVASEELIGNGDGIPSPGETITLDVSFKNVGSEPAEASTASLSLETPMNGATVTGGPFPLGYLDPGQSTGAHRFTVTLAADLPTPALVPLKFTVTPASGESWTLLRPLEVHSFHTISGRVLREDGLGEIPGATVTYAGPLSGTITADNTGSFSLHVFEGNYQLQASAPAYMKGSPLSITLPPSAQNVELRLGQAQLIASPESIAVTLPAGDTTTRTVQITNDGNVPIQWQATVTALPENQGNLLAAQAAGVEADPDRAGVVRMRDALPSVEDTGVDLGGVGIAVLSGSFSSFAPELTSRGATVVALTLPVTPAALEGMSVVVMDDSASSLSATDIALLRQWTMAGGGLFLEGDESVSMGNLNSLMNDSGIQGVVRGSFGSATLTDIAAHEITKNVASIGATSFGAHCTVSGEAKPLVRLATGEVFAAASSLGLGRIFVAGNEITYTSDWNTGDTRLFVNQAVDWLAARGRWLQVLDPASGTLAPGETTSVTLLFDSSFKKSGSLLGTLVLSTDSPSTPKREIAVQLTVTEAAAISFEPQELSFPDTALNGSVTREISIENPGTQPLLISEVTVNHPAFSIVLPVPTTLMARQRLVVPVTFHPGSIGLLEGQITVSSNDPTHPVRSAPLRGSSFTGALLSHSPASFSLVTPQGSSRTEQLLIRNPGDLPLEWSASFTETSNESANDTDPMARLLADLDLGYQNITALIPGRFDFTDGVSGNYISDGGSDMYDTGNYLSTDLASTNLNYSDGLIVAAPASLGGGGRYFTRKYPGLFVFSAEMEGVTSFKISGGTGADGSGTTNGSELTMAYHGKTYRGFLKRTYGTSDPSINHLIIVEDTSGLSHSFPTDTNLDDHTVTGLLGTRQLYYLLYASAKGTALSEEEVARPIIQAFLQIIDPGLSWVYAVPDSGSVPPGGSTAVEMRFDATHAAPGRYKGTLDLQHTQAGRPAVVVPLALEVTAAPILQVSAETLEFPPTSIGSSRSQVLQVTNGGSAPLSIQASLTGSPFFSLPLLPTLPLAGGETRAIALHFTPTSLGNVQGTLNLTTNMAGQPTRQIGLQGSGVAAGALSVAPKSLALSLTSGASLTQDLSLANGSNSAISWSASVMPSGTGLANKPLQGLKALVISSSSSSYDDLLARLITDGADASYVNYYDLLPAQLQGVDLIYIDGNIDYLSVSNISPMRAWIMEGGALFLGEHNSSYLNAHNLLAGSGLTLSAWGYNSPVPILLPHLATNGIAPLPSAYYYSRLAVADPAVPIMRMGTTNVGAVSFLGKGRVACFGDDVFYDKSGQVAHLDLAVRLALWGSHRLIEWLDVSPLSGSVAANGGTPLQVSLQAAGLAAGDHFAEIRLSSTNPAQELTVPVSLSISGTPDLETTPGALTLPATFAGTFREQNLTLENRGAVPLVISAVESSFPELSVAGAKYPLTIPPFGNTVLRVRHQPASASGPFSGNLMIHSNDPGQPTLQVPVSGNAILPPVAALETPLPLQFTLAAGTTATSTLTLANHGSSELTWSVPTIAVSSTPDLASTLSKLDANQASVTAAIPNCEQFEEGLSGNQILDGGENLFDGGNRISTSLSISDLLYTNGTVTAAPESLGTNGQYFTRKYPGLFVFAGDLNNVSEFRIRGNLGANGSGIAEGSSVLLQRGQVSYRGFVKRVHGPGLRSLHHLVIVEDKAGLAHSFASDTNDDAHTLSGLAGATRLYYLAYVGSAGSVSDDAQVKGIMSSFIDAILGTPAFRSATPASGTVAAGGSTTITVTANASGLIGGLYRASMEVATNDPVRPVVLVPVELTVIGIPAITLSRSSATFTPVFAGANAATITATVTNSGTEVLAVSSLTVDAPFTVTPADSSFSLVPGASRTLTLGFNSPQTGSYQGKLTLLSNAGNTPATEISLSASATPPPLAATDATSFSVNLQGGLSTATRSFNLSNPGGASLQWTASVDYPTYTVPDGKDLAGLRVGVFSVFSAFLRDLETRLIARGATVTYLGASASPDPSPYDVIFIDQTVDSLSADYATKLKNWIDSGGCVLVTSNSPSTTRINALMSGSGIVAATTGSGFYTYLQTMPHPITSGVTSIYNSGFGGYLQFNLSGQAVALARTQLSSTTYANGIAVAPQGKGWVIASSAVFYDVFAASTTNRKFTDQCFSWLAGRLRGFVTPTPASGTTAIGGSSTAGFTINPAGMLPGTYQATLKYATNSPAQPLISIPITIEIPVESTLLVNKPSITFADSKLGVSAVTSLRIDHKGTVPVTISALELPPGFTFTLLPLPLTLRGGASVSFNVIFKPTTAGPNDGDLRIVSNALTPPAVVPLSGNAILGPVLDGPSQLPAVTRFAGASTVSVPLHVANAGPDKLSWSASAVNPTPLGSGSPALGGLRVGVFANNHQSLLSDLATWGVTATNIPSTAGLLEPEAYDTIVIDTRMTSLVSAHFTALRNWVKAGGTLILEGGTYSSVSRLNSLIKDSGISATHVPVATLQASGFATHPMMQNVNALTAADCEIGLAATGQATQLAALTDGRGFVCLGTLGQGDILALGQQLFSDARYTTGSARLLAANALNFLRRARDVTWLTCSTTGGLLDSGSSADFSLSFNSAGLPPGTYRRQFRLESNDQLRRTVLMLAEFKVLAPWTILPSPVDFGAVMQGDLRTCSVVISGDNTEPIIATAASLAEPFHLHGAAGFPVVAGSPVTLPLTFQPATEGEASATLNLQTIAGDIAIPLHGSGVSAGGFPMADFSAWRALHLPAGGPFTGLHDDPDGDGLDLGVEYAFLRDPLQRDAANPIEVLGLSPTSLRVGYRRRGSFPDSAILLDTSDDLSVWSPFSPAGRALHENPDGSTNVEIEIPCSGVPRLFLRSSVGTR